VFEGLPLGALTNGIGVVTICVIVAWCLAKGIVVTRRDDIRADRDRWRSSAEVSAEQVRKMLAEEQTSVTVMRSIEAYIRNRDSK
jgi:hypothetical protein